MTPIKLSEIRIDGGTQPRTEIYYPLLAAGKPAEYFNMSQINKARKLNQRAKAHRRGCPTAGKSSVQSGVFYLGNKPYINPKTQEKKALRRKLNLSGKSLRRFEKKIGRLQCIDKILNNETMVTK